LVGQAMKETKGKANPQMLNKIFIWKLEQFVKNFLKFLCDM
jgi:Asp-tRNA(Asn)/Glu-tRNA(Gln) amidotransferase B subunit